MPRPRRSTGLAVLFAALALAVIPAAAVHAAPLSSTLDPACASQFQVTSIFVVKDTDTAPAGLPPEITRDDMSCIIAVGGIEQIYTYLDDPRAKFGSLVEQFLNDGWTVQQVQDDGTLGPFDVVRAEDLASTGGVNLVASRGNDQVGFYYTNDSENSEYFAAGVFIYSVLGGAAGVPLTGGTTVNDPSTISDLKTIATSVPNGAQSGVLVVTASLLTVLLGLPAYLLSMVFLRRYDRWFGWLDRGRVGQFRQRLVAADSGTARRRWVFLVIGILVASLIACFVDPQFGFNGMSVRLYLTLLVSFTLFNVGAWGVITLVLRRVDSTARPTLTLHPATLVAVALAVLLSRLLDFNPGIVFGLVAGITFAAALVLSREALVIIVGSSYAAAVALVAWVIYSLINIGGVPTGVIPVSASEFFGSITLEGVSTLPIALIPLATLDGGILFRWKKWVWAIAYALGLALFMLVLFTVPGGTEAVDNAFWHWVVVFAVFAVVATGVWFVDWLARTGRIGPKTPVAEA